MSGNKGIAPHCQDCGVCNAISYSSVETFDDKIVEAIISEVVKTLTGGKEPERAESGYPYIPLGVSNRHAHLTRETFEKLFGAGAQLERYRDLYQEGDFASKQTITIVGAKMRAIQNVRILGPLRDYDQVELSLTDAVQIGINPPVRASGDVEGAAPLTLIGPKRSVYMKECAIIANRHIHMSSADAERFGVKDRDFCVVRIRGTKSTIFENVMIRINDTWQLQMHLDTDDANAANVRCLTKVEFLEKM